MENYFDPEIFVIAILTVKIKRRNLSSMKRNLRCISRKILKACLTNKREYTYKVKEIIQVLENVTQRREQSIPLLTENM